jgi:hypothetical protein
MPEQPEQPEIAWVGADELPVEFANIFSIVLGEQAVFLNLGSLVPPTIESEEQLAAFRFLAVKPIARVALTPGNIDGLIEALDNARTEFKRNRNE